MIAETLRQPIESPAAWRGGDLARDPSWRRMVTADDAAVLLRASAAAEACGASSTSFPAAEFPIPELQPLLGWLAHRLEQGPGVARLSGIPVRRLSRGQ